MHFEVWHGTNQAFTTFDPSHLGLNTSNGASRAAFFFAARPDTAWAYADLAAKHLVPQQETHERRVKKLLDAARLAERRGNFAASERLTLEAEEIEIAALRAPPAGQRVLRCSLRMERPFEIDGSDPRVVTNLASVLDMARAAGHDGVILRGILDTPSGEGERDDHFAVFDASQIEILEICLDRGKAEPALDAGVI